MGERPSRFFLVRLRKKRPLLGWTLTVLATAAAFALSIPPLHASISLYPSNHHFAFDICCLYLGGRQARLREMERRIA